jgi:rod shape-determining protein MreD
MSPRTERTPLASGTATGRMLPIATLVLAVLLPLEPLYLPGSITLTPAFPLMVIYYWTLNLPDLLPPLALFAIGLTCDFLSGGLPGETPLLFLLSRTAVLRCRRRFFNRPFPLIWVGFTALTVVALLGVWLLNSLLTFQFAGFNQTVFRAALTSSLFPISSFLLSRAQQALIGRS